MRSVNTWDTADELNYVARLANSTGATQSLANYLAATAYRVEWGAVDGAAVRARARELLNAPQKGNSNEQ